MNNRVAVAEQAVLAAGEAVMQFDPQTVAAQIKSTAGDLVTAADLASERVIQA